MGTGEMPLLVPVTRSVSASISRRTSSKSVNFFPLQCRNSAYSAPEAESGWGWDEGAKLGVIITARSPPGSHFPLGIDLHTHTPQTLPFLSSLPTATPCLRYAFLFPLSRWGMEDQGHTASKFSG